jgi:hypothetical protein
MNPLVPEALDIVYAVLSIGFTVSVIAAITVAVRRHTKARKSQPCP